MLHIFYLFFLALTLAILETQIEGSAGWAKNLPAWRPKKDKKYAKLFAKIMGGKDLTGYHLAMFGFVIMIFHYPFFAGMKWNFEQELKTLSLFFLFIVVWDFLWFVVNPHFSLKNFHRHFDFWHRKWLWLAPIDYYFSIGISLILALFTGSFFTWFLSVIIFLTGSFFTWFFIKITKPEWE